MNEARLPFPQVIITGGLGGLGTTLGLALREQGVPVTVVDVMHPGCAPFAVFEHRKQLLEQAGAEVRLEDMRRDSLPDELLRPNSSYSSFIPPVWLHCAFPPPPDSPDVPVESYHELAYDAPARWMEIALQRGWFWMAMQHLPAMLADDARLLYPSWQAVFNAERRLRQEFFPDVVREKRLGIFPFLPGLFGRHQSPHTQPLRQYLQLLAGREVSVCAFDKPWSVTWLESTAHDMLQVLQSVVSKAGYDVDIRPNPYPDLLARSQDWLVMLRAVLTLDEGDIKVRSDQSPGSYFPTEAYSQLLARLPEFAESGFAVIAAEELRRVNERDVRELIDSWNDLPWVPPPDWPRQLSRGRGRRKRKS